jgi:predicted metal-dependent hydrolase
VDSSVTQYDPRYLAGIVLFNRGDFFEAHEVWESLWMDTHGPDKQFFQGLIQAAVGLCHFCNGNLRGAVKLYHSSRDYMQRYSSPFMGLDQAAFWSQMERCFADVLAPGAPDRGIEVPEEFIPTIRLEPEPTTWPDPAAYLDDEHD